MNNSNKNRSAVFLFALLITLGCILCTCTNDSQGDSLGFPTEFDLSEVSEYNGAAYAVVNHNTPYFDTSQCTNVSFEYYSPLDAQGRCSVVYACIGKDLMPTEGRGDIGMVKPSGWRISKYDFVDGKYLYNRCHLIGFQLSGENANTGNLITGTRYMNVQGMLPFENMIADYVRETNNHVMYRVTPIFEGKNLLAAGVLMEAWSVEDMGEGVCFNVFCYNVQPMVYIDYATGENRLVSDGDANETEEKELDYVLNTRSKKFHYPYCSSVQNMSENNKEEYHGSREELVQKGYTACGDCRP